jgi:hypothetical protein
VRDLCADNLQGSALDSDKHEVFYYVPIRHGTERRYKNGDRGQTYHFTHVCGQETTQDEYFQLTTASMVSSSEWQWLPAVAAACDARDARNILVKSGSYSQDAVACRCGT